MIAIDRDPQYAPCCFLICRAHVQKDGPDGPLYDWDTRDDKNTVLVQTDWDWPGIARAFGWDGKDDDIEAAGEFLDQCVNEARVVEDPGYFTE
jgi:hypothetical protein